MSISTQNAKAILAKVISASGIWYFSDIPLEYRHSKKFILETINYYINHPETQKLTCRADYEVCQYLYSPLLKKLKEDKDIISAIADLCISSELKTSVSRLPDEIIKAIEIKRRNGNEKEMHSEMVVSDFSSLTLVKEEYLSDRDFWLLILEKCSIENLEDYAGVLPQFLYDDRTFKLEVASRKGEALKHIWGMLDYCDDEEVILSAIPNYPEIYNKEASVSMQENINVIKAVLLADDSKLSLVPKKVFDDEKNIKEVLEATDGDILEELERYDLTDKELFLEAINYSSNYIEYFKQSLLDDYEFVKQLVKANGEVFYYLPEKLKEKRELLMIALETDKSALEDYLVDYKDDIELIKFAISKGAYGRNDVPDYILQDFELAKMLMGQNPEHYNKLSETFREDEELSLIAIKHTFSDARGYQMPNQLKYFGKNIPKKLLENKAFLLKAIENGLWLSYAPEQFRKDEDVVRIAMKTHSDNAQFIPYEIRCDFELLYELLGDTNDFMKYLAWTKFTKINKQRKKIILDIIKKTPNSVRYMGIYNQYYFEFVCEAIKKDIASMASIFFEKEKTASKNYLWDCKTLCNYLIEQHGMTEEDILDLTETKIILNSK